MTPPHIAVFNKPYSPLMRAQSGNGRVQMRTGHDHFFSKQNNVCQKQPLQDDFLIDLTSVARQIFTVPVFMTQEAWSLCLLHQDHVFALKTTIISILCQAKVAIKQSSGNARGVNFLIKWLPRTIESHLNKQRLRVNIEYDNNHALILILMLDRLH